MRATDIVNNLLETDDAEIQRYIQQVKPQRRRLSKEFLRYVMSTPEGKKKLLQLRDEPEPGDSEPHQIVRESIEQKLLAAAKGIKHCGDYGCLYYHPGKQEVHWTAGDSDGSLPDFTPLKEIEKLLKLPGIKHVEIGDEWSPKGEGWKRLNESEEPEDIRSEVDRLLPTKTYRLGGNSMICAPGVIRMAQNEWRNGRKKQKAWALNLIKSWQGLPEEVYLAILNGKVEVEADGDNAVVTVKEY